MSSSQESTPQKNDQQQQQHAFQEFMLANKNSKKKPSPRSTPTSPESMSSMDLSFSLPNKFSVQEKQMERRIWANFHSFRQTVEQEWFDLEERITQTMDGISNIQYRIPMEIQFMNASRSRIEKRDDCVDWIHFGFTNTSLSQPHLTPNITGLRSIIHVNDVHRTLIADTIQHELLLSSLRTLVSSLAQCQNELGRKLEDGYRLFEQTPSLMNPIENQVNANNRTSKKLFDIMNQLFQQLSEELYKKQYYACHVLGIEIENMDMDLIDDIDTSPIIENTGSFVEIPDGYFYSSKVLPKNMIPCNKDMMKQLLETPLDDR